MVVNGTGRQIYYFDGTVKKEEGNIHKGLLQGVWIEYFETGEKKAQGNYDKGRKYGQWTSWNKAGLKIEEKKYVDNIGHYRNAWDDSGKQFITEGNGFITTYYPNENKNAEGAVKNGEKFGDWTEWFESGQIRNTYRYEEAENYYFGTPCISLDCWDSLGNQIAKDGTGWFMRYNEDNQLVDKSYLTDSKWDGLNTDYHSNGTPEVVDLYENGNWVYRIIFHNNGNKAYELPREKGYTNHGRVRRWNYDGQLISDLYYYAGEQVTNTLYYSDEQKRLEFKFCEELNKAEKDNIRYFRCKCVRWDRNGF